MSGIQCKLIFEGGSTNSAQLEQRAQLEQEQRARLEQEQRARL